MLLEVVPIVLLGHGQYAGLVPQVGMLVDLGDVPGVRHVVDDERALRVLVDPDPRLDGDQQVVVDHLGSSPVVPFQVQDHHDPILHRGCGVLGVMHGIDPVGAHALPRRVPGGHLDDEELARAPAGGHEEIGGAVGRVRPSDALHVGLPPQVVVPGAEPEAEGVRAQGEVQHLQDR
jgi:hypothetical protein